MGIFELDKNIYNPTQIRDILINDIPNNKYISSDLSKEFNKTLNITIFQQDMQYHHKDYLALLVILMIAFFILSYYLYYTAKYSIKKAKNTNTETTAMYSKYSNLQNLSIANFSKYFFK